MVELLKGKCMCGSRGAGRDRGPGPHLAIYKAIGYSDKSSGGVAKR